MMMADTAAQIRNRNDALDKVAALEKQVKEMKAVVKAAQHFVDMNERIEFEMLEIEPLYDAVKAMEASEPGGDGGS